MMYLIDTDWVIDYLKGRRAAIELLTSLAPSGIAISLITYGEIYEGIYYGHNPQRHEQIFQAFLQLTPILLLNTSILRRFASIRGYLRASGQLIGDADLLIAATALVHHCTLVTQNTRHFSRVPDLQIHTVR